jgi:hypothetical protein
MLSLKKIIPPSGSAEPAPRNEILSAPQLGKKNGTATALEPAAIRRPKPIVRKAMNIRRKILGTRNSRSVVLD